MTGVAIEGLGDNATKYRSGHDADAYQFLLDLIPIIHIVSQDRYITTYENNCLTIGKFTPLMTKSMWKGLTRAMFYNEIYAYSGSLKLSLRELLIQMKTNPYIYGISSNMANSQFAAFGFQSDCLISRNMDIWWFIFEHSNDPIICEKFMQQRNLI